MAQWVDIKAIRQAVSMEQVLAYYGLLESLKRKGDNLTGPCPMHGGRNASQFHVNVRKKVFHCFGDCKSDPTLRDGGGNILDFVRKMEGIIEPDDPENRKAARKAALLLQDWFGVSAASQSPPARPAAQRVCEPVASAPEVGSDPDAKRVKEKDETPEPANAPLKFALKNVDPEHPYLRARGFTDDTIRHFGVGYFSGRGMMQGRVVIPIHNAHGELIAYAGRWPGDDVPEGEGKYKLPPNFRKSQVVFNLHRVRESMGAPLPDTQAGLVIVEGYFGCMRVWQAGIRPVVALMGSTLSAEQERLIVETVGPQGKVSLLFDGDPAGRDCREDVLERLSRRLYVKAIDLGEDGMESDGLSDDQLQALLS